MSDMLKLCQLNEAGHPRRFYDSVILLFLVNIVFIIAS
jgi:hypothetical protein